MEIVLVSFLATVGLFMAGGFLSVLLDTIFPEKD